WGSTDTCQGRWQEDEVVYKELDDRLVRATTNASSLEAEHDSESLNDEQSLGKDASKQGRRISDIYADEGTTLVSTQDDAEMFDVNDDLCGEEVFVARQIEKVIEEVFDAAQGVDATQEYYKLYLISLINSCYHTVFYMAQQIVPAD
nr:hypothetical protein [Tanacetum cinerariifolium]